MLQGFHTCNRACSQSSLKRAVIALLHVAVIHHRITLYKDSITPAASPAQHVNQPVLRVIRWTVNGGFADMFLGSSNGYETSVLRHQMQLHLVHSLQLLQQPLPLLLRAQKQTPLKQELHRCSRSATSAVSGPYSDATEPGYTALLTAFTGLFQARQDGGHSSVPNLRSLGSSPCYAAEAAWWYHGAKQARTMVPPKPRLNRENRHPWYHVSEAVPPQRPVVPPPVVSPVFPFVTPICPPFAP